MEVSSAAFGTRGSLMLRLGQIIFSIGSLFFMYFHVDFHCYLVTIMGLVIPWSMTLAGVDAYTLFVKRLPRKPTIVMVVAAGDWALSFLSLASASATASVTDILQSAQSSLCHTSICARYQLSAVLAFFAWFLTFASCLFNLWILPSL